MSVAVTRLLLPTNHHPPDPWISSPILHGRCYINCPSVWGLVWWGGLSEGPRRRSHISKRGASAPSPSRGCSGAASWAASSHCITAVEMGGHQLSSHRKAVSGRTTASDEGRGSGETPHPVDAEPRHAPQPSMSGLSIDKNDSLIPMSPIKMRHLQPPFSRSGEAFLRANSSLPPS